METKELLEQQMKAFEDFKRENDKLAEQVKKTGTESATTRQNVETLQKKLDEIGVKLDAAKTQSDGIEAKLNRVKGGTADTIEQKHLDELARAAGKKSVTLDDYTAYKSAFNAFIRKGSEEYKSLSVNVEADGGVLVVPDMSGRIAARLFDISPIRQIAAVQTISSDTLEGLNDLQEAGAGWVGETESRTETTTPQLGKWSIPTHELYANPFATQKLLDDAYLDAEAWLAGKVTQRFARLEGAAFCNGTGVKQPRGLFTYTTALNNTTWGQMEHFNSGASGAFAAAASSPADCLIDVTEALRPEYRNGARFLMARATQAAVRKLKATDGQYLWQPSLQGATPATLAGYPVTLAEDAPALAANSLSIAFGNFTEGYQIVDRAGIRVLRDPYTNKPYVGFYTTKRTGGGVVNFDAIKFVRFGTSG